MGVRLFQVGAGSGGIAVLDLLAHDERISHVTLVEPDVYQSHNVYRHHFPHSAVGRGKAELAAEWLKQIRPELQVEIHTVDLTDPQQTTRMSEAVKACDLGVCAVDNEVAKYHFDALMQAHRKPWTLGEVLSGGIGGWVHSFTNDGPCYGCVASYLQRSGPTDAPPAPPPNYADANAQIQEATVPASKASIAAIASWHALRTLEMVEWLTREPTNPVEVARTPHPNPPPQGGRGQNTPTTDIEHQLQAPSPLEGEGWGGGSATATTSISLAYSSLLVTLAKVPGVFDEAYRTHRFKIPKSLDCLLCSSIPVSATGEELDVALDQALNRLAHE